MWSIECGLRSEKSSWKSAKGRFWTAKSGFYITKILLGVRKRFLTHAGKFLPVIWARDCVFLKSEPEFLCEVFSLHKIIGFSLVCLNHTSWMFHNYNDMISDGEKGIDLIQSYNKSPYTSRNVKRAKWQRKQRHKKSSITQRLRTDLGRSVGVTTAT